MTDPIADYLTRLRNAISAKHRVVEVPASNLKKEITKILFEKGYILNYKFVEDGPQGTIKVALKYDSVNKVNAIKKLERVSSPGMRKYTGYKDMPRVINGLGIAIISTSKGVMTNKEAAELKIGGEVLCYSPTSKRLDKFLYVKPVTCHRLPSHPTSPLAAWLWLYACHY